MLDLFTIFSKGGIVLWCFQGTNNSLTLSVNALIKGVILQEKGGKENFTHDALALKYKLDNEFELIFVVAYQKILALSYVDKFLTDIALEFRNKYKDDLSQGRITRQFDFGADFQRLLKDAETVARETAKAPRAMKTFEQTQKSKKTVRSMIESKQDDVKMSKKQKKKQEAKEAAAAAASQREEPIANGNSSPTSDSNGDLDEETRLRNLEKLRSKLAGGKKKKSVEKSPEAGKRKGKAARVWDDCEGKDSRGLNYCSDMPPADSGDVELNAEEQELIGQMKGALKDMEPESSEDEEDEEPRVTAQATATQAKRAPAASAKKASGGWFSGLKSLVGSKTLTGEDIQPVMDKMRDHLIDKNVAADIADKLCNSVATKLEGKVLGTFNTVASTVQGALHESCLQILRPTRRVDILRDAMAARDARRPYVVTFCGVNGVGKSTNLAKVCFWLVENGLRVLIAACDTFRAGAVEQLRTHTRKLNALHPAERHRGLQMVQLYEKGYGKDAAGIAMEAINFARDMKIDVVLVDTAGRMQDNEPLMRALAKLMKVNQPDLVLFVGEALVGNEAVDQLTKFNQALADHSQSDRPRLIDGILLTKFDTIDDKVGAAISMTYTTGQPIVFVGTGQTYTDLKNLNAKAVVNALLK